MNILFLCSQNRWRSRTAEDIFQNQPNFQFRSAGTEKNARHKVAKRDIIWADIIFVMEDKHQARILQNFPQETQHKKIIKLDIPDRYNYMDPQLISLLKTRIGEHLPIS